MDMNKQIFTIEAFKREAAEALTKKMTLSSTLKGIEYIKRGCGELKRLCVAVYSRTVEKSLPKTITLEGLGRWTIVLLSSDLPDTGVNFVPMCTFDEKDD